MTDPRDDRSSTADAGSMDPDTLAEPGPDLSADLGYAGANQDEEEQETGTPDDESD